MSVAKARTYEDFYGPQVYAWVFTDNDTGASLEIPKSSDRSVHIYGTVGGATVTIKGTNNASEANFVTLHDALAGTTLSYTVIDVIAQIMENTLFIRPEVTGGAGINLTVAICIKP